MVWARNEWRNTLRERLLFGLGSGPTSCCSSAAVGLLGVPVSGLVKELVSGLLFGVLGGLLFGLVGGLVSGLRFGGRACLHHFALRLVLWHRNFAPLHYIRFLNYTTARIFLRRVGGDTALCIACCSVFRSSTSNIYGSAKVKHS